MLGLRLFRNLRGVSELLGTQNVNHCRFLGYRSLGILTQSPLMHRSHLLLSKTLTDFSQGN